MKITLLKQLSFIKSIATYYNVIISDKTSLGGIMKRKVAIYARVSTEHESQINALANQIQYYDEIIEKHKDWKLYERYVDEGITGTSINKRKNFVRMIEDAKAGKFDLIITREVSRFARNTVDTLQQTRELKKYGVEVYFTEDNIWTFNDDDGELRLTLMATLAQNESRKTSQRVKAGMTIAMQNGVYFGTGNILGYNKIGKEIVINKEQAEIVKFIFDEYLSGKGCTAIKYECEAKGYKTSTGLSKWSSSYIARLLRNPFYCGTIVYRKQYVPNYLEQKHKTNYGEIENIIVEGKHEPIVSKEDFDKVQKMLDEKSTKIYMNKKKRIGVPKSIWTKKLICQCGSSFHRRIYHKNAYETTYGYVCYRRKQYGGLEIRKKKGLDITNICNIKMIAEWKLETMYSFLIKFILENKKELIRLINEKIESYNNEKNIEELKEYRNKIIDLKVDIDKKLFLNNYINKILACDNEFKWYLNTIDEIVIIKITKTFKAKEIIVEIYLSNIGLKVKYKY